MATEKPARKPSPSDLTDAQWTMLDPLIHAAHTPRGGRPREVDLRDIVPTIVSLNRRGCPGELRPHALRPKSPVYDDVARWRADGPWVTRLDAWRAPTRRQAGREPTPRAACSDSQAVKTTELGGRARGDDGGTQVTGRQRHRLVETLGLVMVVLLTSAGLDDGVAAPHLLQLIEPQDVPRLDTRCADHKYHHHALHPWLSEHRPLWRIEVKTRPDGVTRCTPREKRWVVERTNAWNGRYRRHSKDDERKPESSAAMIYMSTIHLMRRRLPSHCRPEFHDRNVTADSLKLAS